MTLTISDKVPMLSAVGAAQAAVARTSQRAYLNRGKGILARRGVRVAVLRETTNVVEQAIEKVGGSPSFLARQLSKVSGTDVTRQRVHGWRLRGVFPREMMVHVHTLTGIPLHRIIEAKPRDRDQGNIVNRAIRLLGEGATPSQLAAELTKLSGRKITRQMVNGWQAAEQFPVDITPFVHLLVKIPIKELLAGGRRG